VAPGLLLAGLVGFLLTQLTLSTPLWVLAYGFIPIGGIALPLIPMGFGLGLSLSGATIAILNEAPRKDVGAAVGLTRFFQSFGGALGISLLTVYETWRFQVLSSSATTPSEFASALVTPFNEVFLALAICILIAFGFALLVSGRAKTASSPTSGEVPALEKAVSPSPKSE